MGPRPARARRIACPQANGFASDIDVDRFVETHGREETAALIGPAVVPRRRIEYRGVVLEEMDVDAVGRDGRRSRSSTSWPTPTRRPPAIAAGGRHDALDVGSASSRR
jgi:hypothetical protein